MNEQVIVSQLHNIIIPFKKSQIYNKDLTHKTEENQKEITFLYIERYRVMTFKESGATCHREESGFEEGRHEKRVGSNKTRTQG